jgi:hypothetical protein
VYKNVIRIVACAKQKRPRKATLLCAAITNSDVLMYLPRTAVFMRHVSYHTSTGKFRKTSYKTLMKLAALPLAEIERYVKRINTLFPPKSTTTATRKRVGFKFNAITDLEQIKHLVANPKSDKTADTVIESGVSVKRKTKTTADKAKKKKKLKAEKLVSAVETKSISVDDELVIRTLGKEKTVVDVEHGECALMRRGVVMLQTHIPPQVWKRVHTQLGLDVVARQYVTAIYQPVIASPLTLSGVDQTPDQILQNAQAYLSLHNRQIKDEHLKLEIIGNTCKTGSHSHQWFLCMPKCVVHHLGFKFGKWGFASETHARTAHEYSGDVVVVR